jgi:hypothetical protein
MRPWSSGKDYDKPIARRLAEEAGVPRDAFGQIKRKTVLSTPFPWPHSRDVRERYRSFLSDLGLHVPSDSQLRLSHRLARVDNLVRRNILRPAGIRPKWRPWRNSRAASLLFPWANEELAKQYRDGLNGTEIEMIQSGSIAHP